ncbi:hypothetical protein DCAR_0415751 [Daucus carota subsp. sativus]|uniref:Uncharacterized protein n=1 Tax=Daucus carota subsp. sativus TaxID=79200 RepID=A0AAF0WWW7_DAUCS|nr:hypothetical protein DCAR_0415751 [Daucus carota subsp. sativus]
MDDLGHGVYCTHPHGYWSTSPSSSHLCPHQGHNFVLFNQIHGICLAILAWEWLAAWELLRNLQAVELLEVYYVQMDYQSITDEALEDAELKLKMEFPANDTI